MGIRAILSLLVVFICGSPLFAQFNLKKQIPDKMKYEPAAVYDSTYGIQIYENLNLVYGTDSVRNCGSYACQAWIEDFYTSGALLHKGFYLDGQLQTYKNFYPNGVVERDFRSVDAERGIMKIYFENGALKSEIKYNHGISESWIDYNEKGIIVLQEQMEKHMKWFSFKKTFYDDGSPKTALEITDKKKAVYSYKEYHPGNKIALEGIKFFVEEVGDYVYDGTWKYYDENGKVIKEEVYSKGLKIK